MASTSLMSRLPAVALLLTVGCFKPTLDRVECARDGTCPPEQECDLASSMCVSIGTAECVQPPCHEPVAWAWEREQSLAVDILFVIDNSGSMEEEQEALAASSDQFFPVLEQRLGALPDLHVGVISTDAGTGPGNGGTGCSTNGDDGVLRTNGTCGIGGNYIIDTDDGDGTRTRNYPGALSDAFSCLADLGISGCGFERTLESLRRALNGSNSLNDGFLRDNALLAIYILSDEDDCSAVDTGMFNTSQNDLSAPLGQVSSFRCFEFGVTCECPDGQTECESRGIGERVNCRPKEDSLYMESVDNYVQFAKGLKMANERQIVVGGAIGNIAPVNVRFNESGVLVLQPSCNSLAGEAVPGVRLHYFIDQFTMGVSGSICDENQTAPLLDFGEYIAHALGSTCILAPMTEPYDCIAEEIASDGRAEVPPCSDPGSPLQSVELPCYVVGTDTARCGDATEGLTFEVFRGGSAPDDSYVELRCR